MEFIKSKFITIVISAAIGYSVGVYLLYPDHGKIERTEAVVVSTPTPTPTVSKSEKPTPIPTTTTTNEDMPDIKMPMMLPVPGGIPLGNNMYLHFGW